MKKFVRHWMVLFAIFTIFFMIGLEITSAEDYFMGKVVGIHEGQLTVKGDKGETMYFALANTTVFVPTRLPGVDEQVKVTYFLRNGNNVATQVEILSGK
jgi:hypothetical protein